MINLIPQSAKKHLLKEYWIRVMSVWLMLWAVALFVGAVLMLPVWVLINSQVEVYRTSAEEASARVADYEEASLALEQASAQSVLVTAESKKPKFSDYITLIHELTDEQIIIKSMSLNRDKGGVAPMRLTGVATNRQALASFRDRLLASDTITEVDLPISNLASGRDSLFSITITFSDTAL